MTEEKQPENQHETSPVVAQEAPLEHQPAAPKNGRGQASMPSNNSPTATTVPSPCKPKPKKAHYNTSPAPAKSMTSPCASKH